MIEQVEVVGSADVAVVVERECQPLAASVIPRARGQDKQVADQLAGRGADLMRERRRQEVLVGTGQEWKLAVRAEVLDPDAAEIQSTRERSRLRQHVQSRTGSPGRLC